MYIISITNYDKVHEKNHQWKKINNQNPECL